MTKAKAKFHPFAITLDQLRNLRACDEAQDRFAKKFGKRFVVTAESVRTLTRAGFSWYDIEWFVEHALQVINAPDLSNAYADMQIRLFNQSEALRNEATRHLRYTKAGTHRDRVNWKEVDAVEAKIYADSRRKEIREVRKFLGMIGPYWRKYAKGVAGY